MSEICVHCRKPVDFFEGIIDEFLWYHTHCYYLLKSKKADKLQKKFNGNTITLNEAEELAELMIILPNVKKFVDAPTITTSQVFNHEKPIFFGKSEGMHRLDQHIIELKKHKAMEAARTAEQKKLPPKTNQVSGFIKNGKH